MSDEANIIEIYIRLHALVSTTTAVKHWKAEIRSRVVMEIEELNYLSNNSERLTTQNFNWFKMHSHVCEINKNCLY
jgi:hypothetical protein